MDKYNLSGKSLKTKADLCLRMVSPTGIEPVTISLKEISTEVYILFKTLSNHFLKLFTFSESK